VFKRGAAPLLIIPPLEQDKFRVKVIDLFERGITGGEYDGVSMMG
jgi:hypothetical protein